VTSIPLLAKVVATYFHALDRHPDHVVPQPDLSFQRYPTQWRRVPVKEVAGRRCVAKHGYYALTFDRGPFVGTAPRIVEALRKAKAVATFFDAGADAAAHPGLVELQRGVG
jgi:peptidoglycan/xylan/chitin deacetylase (PgdA/CDA1 family)